MDKYAAPTVIALRNRHNATDIYVDDKPFRVPDDIALAVIAAIATKLNQQRNT